MNQAVLSCGLGFIEIKVWYWCFGRLQEIRKSMEYLFEGLRRSETFGGQGNSEWVN